MEDKPTGRVYNAASPDELALVNFAKYSGYEYTGLDESNNMLVEINSKESKYQLEHVLEFTSSRFASQYPVPNPPRKRMSVIVKNPDGEYVLYMKGADSIVLPRCK